MSDIVSNMNMILEVVQAGFYIILVSLIGASALITGALFSNTTINEEI